MSDVLEEIRRGWREPPPFEGEIPPEGAYCYHVEPVSDVTSRYCGLPMIGHPINHCFQPHCPI